MPEERWQVDAAVDSSSACPVAKELTTLSVPRARSAVQDRAVAVPAAVGWRLADGAARAGIPGRAMRGTRKSRAGHPAGWPPRRGHRPAKRGAAADGMTRLSASRTNDGPGGSAQTAKKKVAVVLAKLAGKDPGGVLACGSGGARG